MPGSVGVAPSRWSPVRAAGSDGRPPRGSPVRVPRSSLAARRLDRLEALAAEIGADGGRAIAVQADITDRDQATALVDRTVRELGRLDTLVNNAGVMLLGPVVDAPIDEWDRSVEINVNGVLYA